MTAEKSEPSQFDPSLDDAELEKLQIACVTKEGTLIHDRCHKRTYFQNIGKVIGACAGEKTSLIFVEYVNCGLVHGWPISEKELKKKQA